MKDRLPALILRRRAAALLIVLASLVFLAALALAFLASIGTELKSSKQYADGVSAKLLSQSAFNLATDQIVAATKGYSGPDPTNQGELLAWASQPGMIRTYNSNGQKRGYFKLYSWDIMQGTGDFDPGSASEAISTTWYQNPALYTDLNKPILISGTYQYPIIDGNGLAGSVKDSTGTVSIDGKTYDSNSDTKWDIEGFNITAATPVESASSNPVPMPVKWLYVLEDGQIVAPSSSSGDSVTFSGTNRPTSANPIVGRIAFWTDDDSCKININTAAEGIYWDTPRVKSKQDDVFKVYQPVNGEYQRYPGHPAMTSLSTVLKAPPAWTPGTSPPSITLGAADAVKFTLTATQWAEFQWAKLLYGVVPRIGNGGSAGGTAQTAMLLTGSLPPAMSLDGDRLYASVDELAFKPNRTSNNTELANQGVLNKTLIERAKFFLTASSRSPDVNLFNKPRVAIWPIHATNSANYRTAFDRLIAFCSTFGGYTYYFERSNPNSPTADLGLNRNMKLLTYLRTLAGQNIPGFGGDFSAKYGADKDQIFTEIFDYIRSTNLRDPLLVNSTNELASTSYTVGDNAGAWKNYQSPARGTNGQGQVVPIVDSTTDTRGFGRFVTLTGASLLFIGQVDGDLPLVPLDPDTHLPKPTNPNYPGSTTKYPAAAQADPVTGKPLPLYSGTLTASPITVKAVDPGHMRIQAMFIPQFFSPSVGSTWLRQNFKWSVDPTFTVEAGGTTANLTFGSNAGKTYNLNQWPFDETGFGDQLGLIQAVQSAGANLVSDPIDLPKGQMKLKGSAIVKIYAPDGTELQSFDLNFDSPDAATPSLAWDHVANRSPYSPYNFDDTVLKYINYRSFSNSTGRYNPDDPNTPLLVNGGRITGGTKTRQAGGFIMSGDVVRSVRLASGDGRMVAAQTKPSATLFENNPQGDRVLGTHSFLTGYGNSYYGAELGRLAKDAAYNGTGILTANQNNTNDGGQSIFFNFGFAYGADTPFNGVEVGSNSASTGGLMGDWDNGPFAIRDGPYIGKADEGDVGGGGPAVSDIKEPYFWKIKAQSGGGMNTALFSPNRMIPSAVTFGSLPTGVKANRPWQTLLFRPMPGHPGSGSPVNSPVGPPYSSPPDHLLLELFSMPVVEPYAISEPMSTAGRINMNYQMVPFTYINRDTGIRALLKAEKVTAISDSQANVYKNYIYSSPPQQYARFDVNAEETLKGFKQRFDANDIFRSASEICDLPIVPKDDPTSSPTYGGSTLDTFNTMAAYWETKRLTGDNTKERIYATLYPRLTTKSNTYTIHAKVQTLKKIVGTPADIWTEGKDQVTGEYRGSQTIERYVDPNAAGIPDYSNTSETTPLSSFYKIRVISSKQFAP